MKTDTMPKTSTPQRMTFAGVSTAVILALLASLQTSEKRIPKPYYDSFGVLTVCAGVTEAGGYKLDINKTYTTDECILMEASYVKAMYARMGRCVPKRTLTFHEAKAWGHFAYNTGEDNFCASSAARKLNDPSIADEDTPQICEEMLRWRFGGRIPGSKPPQKWDCSVKALSSQHKCYGLWRRRQWEYQTCIGKTPSLADIP